VNKQSVKYRCLSVSSDLLA